MTKTHFLKLILISCLPGSLWGGDAGRGAMVVQNMGCLQCHTIRGEGLGHEAPDAAPDLGGSLARKYTPAAIASALWNHAPAMWTQMASRNVTAMAVTESNWEDLFAYLYSLHIFEFPAQVRRGREVLLEKRCTRCHAVPDAPKPVAALGKPVSAWRVDDPVEFVFGMWNHAAAMRDRIAAAREDWRTLSGRDLMDLTAYAQYVQKTVPMREFTMPDPAAGRSLFEANCGNCHRGSMSLAERLRNTTWMDIAAGMWNHVPRMPALPFVSSEDMRKILAYTWELQYMGEPGSPTRGENAFERKRCAACHSDAATKAHVSPRPGKTFTPFSIAALGWGPGRQMHQQMLERGVSWPRLSPTDVADLAAYLTALSKTAPERR